MSSADGGAAGVDATAEVRMDEIDLVNLDTFVGGVPFQWFRYLRHEAPVFFHEDPTSVNGGWWCVTRYDDCVTVNRDWEHFTSSNGALFNDFDEEQRAQQGLMMLNMDPPLHTRYRRLVNKGFTPRMVRDLEARIVEFADQIIDSVCQRGTADFVEEMSAELPLMVIAELLGIPLEDRRQVFDWSNKMIGSNDPEFQVDPELAGQVAMELYAYADRLTAERRISPRDDLLSVLTTAEVEGETLSQLEIDLFFLLLSVAGNETTRNLMSGAMTAFFQHPDQWQRLVEDRSLLDPAVEEMLRFVTPVMHFRRDVTAPVELGGQTMEPGDKVVFWHISANRDEQVFDNPDRFDIGRDPNPHIAFGGGGPHFCLGANLARMEIKVMFDRLATRLPDIHQDGEVQRLRSNFINGTKHLPVAFTPTAPAGGGDRSASGA